MSYDYDTERHKIFTDEGQSSRGKRDLHVHHIDYNKKNHSVANLIPLCGSCHMKTNANRDEWKSFFHTAIGRGR